jgi:hypothetical protein
VTWRLAVAAAVLVVVAGVAESRAEDRKADAGPDLSTAKSTTLAWIDASWAGNSSVVQQVLVDDEQQREFMAGPLRFSAALRALEAAAVKRFGEPGRQVTGYPDGSAKAMEKHLDIKEEGDRATASLGEAMRRHGQETDHPRPEGRQGPRPRALRRQARRHRGRGRSRRSAKR